MSSSRKVDINVASAEELATLNGVGRAKADAIVDTRASLGGFSSVDNLMLVPGIGSSLIDQNRGHLTCSFPGRSNSKQRAAKTKMKDGKSSRDPASKDPTSTDLASTGTAGSPGSEPAGRASREKSALECPCSSNEHGQEDFEDEALVVKTIMHGLKFSDGEIDSDEVYEELSVSDQEMNLSDGEAVKDDEEPAVWKSSAAVTAGDADEKGETTARTEKAPTAEAAGANDEDAGVHCSRLNAKMKTDGGKAKVSDKALMKRKSDPNVDHRGHSPGKKPCWTTESTSVRNGVVKMEENPGDQNTEEMEKLSLTPKKRLQVPSRPSPPANLSDWLSIFQSWSSTEKLLALDQLIDSCEPTEVRHMMNVIEPQFQRDFISLLPKELALYVLSFLEPKDLLRAAQTCRVWRGLAEDNLLWKEKCRQANIEVRVIRGKKRARMGVIPSPWKVAYMRQHNIEMNWRCKPIRTPKMLKGHDDHVITCLQFSGARIVSGSDDNTLKVWSAITGKCLRTLTGHTGGVWSSQMSGNIVVSGSTDRTLKVWDANTGDCLHTLYGHTSTVRCMHLHNNKVVSGSRDATLRVWDIDSGECLHVLVGHVAAVRCVQYDGRLVVSGAYDYMVKVWNPEREECLHTLQGHTNRVYSLQFDGIHVVSGSLDTSIRVWDVETGACKHTLMGHQSLTSGMELKNNILVSGNADSTVKVWDITTGQCLQTLSGPNKHQSAVTCLQFNSKFVITSSDDGTVKLWDLKTGEFIRNLVALDSGGSGGVVWRIRASATKLVCAVGSRNGTEETKLLVLDFDTDRSKS